MAAVIVKKRADYCQLYCLFVCTLFQYVFGPLLFKVAFFGTCLIIRRRLSKSTDDAIEFSIIRNFNVVVNSPNALNISGKIIEIIIKGAIVMKIYLGFEISSSVITKPPNSVIPMYVFSDLVKFGIKIK